MPVLFEVFLSLIRIFILLTGTLIAYLFGATVYNNVNMWLATWSIPCIEIISYLVTAVPVVALFYGIHIQKAFWRRESYFNKKVFLVSFVAGVLLSLSPLGPYPVGFQISCQIPTEPINRFVYAMTTGMLSSLFAFIGMDIGVFLKHTSHHVKANPHRKTVTRPTKTTKTKPAKKVVKKSKKN